MASHPTTRRGRRDDDSSSARNQAQQNEILRALFARKQRQRERELSNSCVNRPDMVSDPRQEMERMQEADEDSDEDEVVTKPVVKPASRQVARLRATIARKSTRRTFAGRSDYEEKNNDNEEPDTLPSESQRHRYRHSYGSDGLFDVQHTRAELMSRLNGERNISGGKSSNASSGDGTANSSLRMCLNDMGFDSDVINVAIASCDAQSSQDAGKVVAWLGDSCEQSFNSESNTPRESGSSLPELTDEERKLENSLNLMGFSTDEIARNVRAYQSSNDGTSAEDYIARMLDNNSVSSRDANRSMPSSEAPREFSNSSAGRLKPLTAEGQKLANSLSEMGFSGSAIDVNIEEFQSSTGSSAEEYISRMLERDNNPISSHPPQSNSSVENDTMDPINPQLLDSLSQMGFEEDQIRNAANDAKKTGISKVGADDVLAVLLENSSRTSTPIARLRSSGSSNRTTAETTRQRRLTRSLPNAMSNTERPGNTQTEEKPLTVEIFPGKFAPVLKGHKTWVAMHNGTSVSADCILCKVRLQCCPEAMYVLCPDCDVVSPLLTENDASKSGKSSRFQMNENEEGIGGSVGLGYKR